jgi:hypothetical protein
MSKPAAGVVKPEANQAMQDFFAAIEEEQPTMFNPQTGRRVFIRVRFVFCFGINFLVSVLLPTTSNSKQHITHLLHLLPKQQECYNNRQGLSCLSRLLSNNNSILLDFSRRRSNNIGRSSHSCNHRLQDSCNLKRQDPTHSDRVHLYHSRRELPPHLGR